LLREGLREQYNLRMFYRLDPPGNCGIDIYVNGSKASILDVSIGGASFSHNKIHPFRVNEEAKITLVIGERASQIESKVVRVWEPENEKVKKGLEFVSIQFLNMNGHTKNELGRKIRGIFVIKTQSADWHKGAGKRITTQKKTCLHPGCFT
jgi:c-di-GMP-binding flagellar brake protein YcgR